MQGVTVYIQRLVDQAGLFLVFDQTGSSWTGAAVGSSAQPAPSSLVATGNGAIDASRGLLGCAAPNPPGLCLGAVTVNGPTTLVPEYYFPVDQLIGSLRTLTATQQVTALAMSFYWGLSAPNTGPVNVSMALYGPPNCGPQGESQLLGLDVDLHLRRRRVHPVR